MAFPVWIDNLIAYSLQIAILASAGTLLAYIFRLRAPRISLFYWQILLLACLVLPALQSWRRPVEEQAVAIHSAIEIPVLESAAEPVPVDSKKASFSITPKSIGIILLAGIGLRLLWLALGFVRLRLFLRKSVPLAGAPPCTAVLCARIGARASFYLSHEIDSPATFGFLSPAVILPGSFHGMSESCRESIVCHELLHVRRRDWLLIMIEEIIRSVYWFHPAVWWLLGRIHLAREQSVDHEVVRLTGSRQPYLDSLLEIARSRGRPKAVPAPLFLKERHLVERVALLLREVSMNRLRLAVSLAGMFALLAGTVVLASEWFPLTGEPVIVQREAAVAAPAIVAAPAAVPAVPDAVAAVPAEPVVIAAMAAPVVPPAAAPAPEPAPAPVAAPVPAPPQREPLRVGGGVQQSQLIHKVAPVYPEPAKKARVSGTVVMKVTVNEEGFVTDVQVESGHPLLSEAAVEAVRQWRYRPTLLNGRPVPILASVSVVFNFNDGSPEVGTEPKAAPITLTFIQSVGPEGRIEFKVRPIEEKPLRSNDPFLPPQLTAGPEQAHRWLRMAAAGWPQGMQKAAVSYMFIIDPQGEIMNFARVQGPEIPDLEQELSRIKAIAPATKGEIPVRAWCVIEFNLK